MRKTAYRRRSVVDLIRKVKLIAFDFDGVFTDNKVIVFEDGREAVICSRSDGIGLSALKELGIKAVVISSEVNSVVSVRCRKLKIPCIQGCEDKLSILKKIATKNDISLDRVLFMGNDINDMECMKSVGLAIRVADSHPSLISVALYATKAKGGRGAVRELCDLVRKVRDEKK